MPDQTHPLTFRRDITQATLDRFKDQPFRFGKRDCVRMCAFHLRAMGYRPQLAKAGSYSSYLGARRALRNAGFTSLGAAIDSLGLEPIAPAAALPGDIVELPSEDEIGALGIAAGNGRLLGYHPDADGAVIVQPQAYVRAWRVEPINISKGQE